MTNNELDGICAKALGLKLYTSPVYKKPMAYYDKCDNYVCSYLSWHPTTDPAQAMQMLVWLFEKSSLIEINYTKKKCILTLINGVIVEEKTKELAICAACEAVAAEKKGDLKNVD